MRNLLAAAFVFGLAATGACRASSARETSNLPRSSVTTEPSGARAPAAEAPAPSPEHDAGAPGGELCDPGEREICVCPDGTTGSRRCDASGRGFSACDACKNGVRCGKSECQMQRIELISLSLPACCPKGREDRCGIDVSYVAKNWGYDATCLELNAPGTLDASCPAISVPLPDGKLAELKGCRTAASRCGYDVRIPGAAELGCTEPPARLSR